MGVSNPGGLELILGAPGMKGKEVTVLSKGGLTLSDFMQSVIFKTRDAEEPFYVLGLGVPASLMDQWTRLLPTVRPFYAVKCNPDPLCAGFDCASRAEIEAILSLGSHIKYAASVGVNLTTFDSGDEVEKIKRNHPRCNLLIRLKGPEDSGAKCPLDAKYGALPEEVVPLLQAAQAAKLTVAGVSFHVGSGAPEARAYHPAIEAAKRAFDAATQLGLPRMQDLNVGGGFTVGQQFDTATGAVKSAIQKYFKIEPGLILMAEPGRFFAELAFTLATNIIGKRVRGELREYWINDGIYGSMNCIFFDHYATVNATPFACSSTVFGPTCDALDTVLTGYQLPELEVNDWLVFPNMGAYTVTAGSNFNGFKTSAIATNLVYSGPR
ncbi:Ornithine decarboxylase [Bertholletia excelsa]